jgi:hypothetical protein
MFFGHLPIALGHLLPLFLLPEPLEPLLSPTAQKFRYALAASLSGITNSFLQFRQELDVYSQVLMSHITPPITSPTYIMAHTMVK